MEISSRIMPKMLNSNPFKERNANTPLIPNNPNNPKAQLGQAGARMAIKILGAPTDACIANCRRIRKILSAVTTPPRREMSIKSINAS